MKIPYFYIKRLSQNSAIGFYAKVIKIQSTSEYPILRTFEYRNLYLPLNDKMVSSVVSYLSFISICYFTVQVTRLSISTILTTST